MSTNITIKNAKKVYDNNYIAVENVSLSIKDGEFFTLLGPSGCGKTTLLRMIAGFNSIEEGTIEFNGKVINNILAYKRNIGMVFQNYAIFPHMTVRENVEYGLKNRNLSKKEVIARAVDMMEKVQIIEHKDKLPDKLSGGQQQRVALARAIVIQPDVLLMDEPLSNLDAKLRVDMRSAIKIIQKKLKITTIYVTHDQEEALAVSDRIAIMNHGKILQVGSPKDIYLRPFNVFVAGFIGVSNFFDGKLITSGNERWIEFAGHRARLDNIKKDETDQSVKITVRPEEFKITSEGHGLKGRINMSTFLGRYTNYNVVLEGGQEIEVTIATNDTEMFYASGDTIYLEAMANKINVFDETGERSLIEGVEQYAE